MELVETLHSKEDASINFIWKGDFPGLLEARYVRRTPDYLVCYLSAQTACAQGCRFCHLTATGQVVYKDARIHDIYDQASHVLAYYKANEPPAKIVHFSFMARGEPLSSQVFLDHNQEILGQLGRIAHKFGLLPRFMVSTIMPESLEGADLRYTFPVIHPTIYYSIYSMDKEFRKKWLPRAMDPDLALDKLKAYQDFTGKIIKLHWCFIKGENDSEEAVWDIIDAVKARKLRVNVNIVRYNPFGPHLGEEPSESIVRSKANLIEYLLPEAKVKVVSRVGYDVAGSCGAFLDNGVPTTAGKPLGGH